MLIKYIEPAKKSFQDNITDKSEEEKTNFLRSLSLFNESFGSDSLVDNVSIGWMTNEPTIANDYDQSYLEVKKLREVTCYSSVDFYFLLSEMKIEYVIRPKG